MNEGKTNPPKIIAKDGHVVPHGTYTAYNRWKCRCVACREVNAEKARLRRHMKAQREGRVIKTPNIEPEHGTRSRYTSSKHRCRCDLCRQANSTYQAGRARLVRAGIPLRPEWETW
jgi:hypothetical protein